MVMYWKEGCAANASAAGIGPYEARVSWPMILGADWSWFATVVAGLLGTSEEQNAGLYLASEGLVHSLPKSVVDEESSGWPWGEAQILSEQTCLSRK